MEPGLGISPGFLRELFQVNERFNMTANRSKPFHPLVSWLLYPVYAWQGIGVRLKTERMLPPAGLPVGEIAGKDPAIRLLVLGDSSSAGVGVSDAWQGLCVRLAVHLQGRTGRKVIWRAAGFNSATSGQLRDHVVPNLERGLWTHIVLTTGTNDTKNFHSTLRFKRNSAACSMRSRRGGRRRISSGRKSSIFAMCRRCRDCSAAYWRGGPTQSTRWVKDCAASAWRSPPRACRWKGRRVSPAMAFTLRRLAMTPGPSTSCPMSSIFRTLETDIRQP